MWLLIVEALIALGLFVFIVWWTVRSRHEAAPPDAELGDKPGEDAAKKELAREDAGKTG